MSMGPKPLVGSRRVALRELIGNKKPTQMYRIEPSLGRPVAGSAADERQEVGGSDASATHSHHSQCELFIAHKCAALHAERWAQRRRCGRASGAETKVRADTSVAVAAPMIASVVRVRANGWRKRGRHWDFKSQTSCHVGFARNVISV